MTKKEHTKCITALVSLAAVLMPFAAGAAFHEVFQQKSRDVREQIQQKREDLKKELQEGRAVIKDKAGEMKADVAGQKSEMQDRMRVMKREMQEKREAMAAETKKEREGFQAKAAERRGELKKKLGEKRAENIERFFKRMTEKTEAALDRLNHAADRIDRMIEKASNEGKDAARAQEGLASARTKIDQAAAALEEAKAKYGDLAKNTDLKKAFADVRDLMKTVSQAVKDAHAALVSVVAGLKGLGGGSAATTTPAATSSPAQ